MIGSFSFGILPYCFLKVTYNLGQTKLKNKTTPSLNQWWTGAKCKAHHLSHQWNVGGGGGGGGGLNLSFKLFKISGCSWMEPYWRILTLEWFLLVFIGICVLRTKLIEIVGWQPYLTWRYVLLLWLALYTSDSLSLSLIFVLIGLARNECSLASFQQ